MEIVHQYVAEIGEVARFGSNQKQVAITKLGQLLSLDPVVNGYIVQFNQVPFQLDDAQVDAVIEAAQLFDGEWLALNELVASFIRVGNQLNPQSSLESFDLYTSFVNDVSIAFSNNARGHLLIEVVKNAMTLVLPLANHLDYQLYYKEACQVPRLTYLASILLKMFNNIRSQVNDASNVKRNIILFISNKLCSVYFKINSPLLCRNVFSNMNNANVSFQAFDKLEQLQYRYYLAKFYLIKQEITSSFYNFDWCLQNLPVSATKNITRVLQYHLPLSLVIGKRLNMNISYISDIYGGNVPTFVHIYYKLNEFMKSGDLRSFNSVVLENYQFLKSQNLLLLLLTKSKMVILRNLLKKIWINTGKPTTIDYDHVVVGLRLSLDTNPLTLPLIKSMDELDNNDLLIENIFIALIDQNLIKGKIFPRLRKVVLAKNNVFPTVDGINILRFPPTIENWMNT